MEVRDFLEKEAGLKVLRETRNGELMMYCPLHDDSCLLYTSDAADE